VHRGKLKTHPGNERLQSREDGCSNLGRGTKRFRGIDRGGGLYRSSNPPESSDKTVDRRSSRAKKGGYLKEIDIFMKNPSMKTGQQRS